MSTPRDRLLIDAERLAALPRERLVVLAAGRRDDFAAAGQQQVIPGALPVVLEDDLAGDPDGVHGRLPLPTPAALTQRLRRWGVHDDSVVVVYAATPKTTPSVATRAWFVLRWAGLPDVRLLDGGVEAWTRAGKPLAAPLHGAEPGTATATPGHLPTLDADEAALAAGNGRLYDTRSAGQYALGHIPGAASLPVGRVFQDGRLLPPDELAAIAAGTDAPAAYCGGGVAATGVAFAFATLGVTVPVYVASWSGWTADTARPVETKA
ncbi:rhodanese-like domain-containing protein [Phytohabitans sp. ZYX-F-186]|uniref:thiosulfate sulfurtransferase n=1 Tax=Phytohabitans maris TaxID=3071409 RepID=A0ABU0ZK16_9ACTN|nr:rhodanese-like domain-containing protein [Phytohabitans sp. ZYX-F-186]MDQ7907396.1 rhodanese-like domain-containing protein [Phytohabitans sp. ZYX-F-186]